MKLPERVAELYERMPHAEIKAAALDLLDKLKDKPCGHAMYEGENIIDVEQTAVLIAAFLIELTRATPSDAPRIYKRVVTDHIAVSSSVS